MDERGEQDILRLVQALDYILEHRLLSATKQLSHVCKAFLKLTSPYLSNVQFIEPRSSYSDRVLFRFYSPRHLKVGRLPLPFPHPPPLTLTHLRFAEQFNIPLTSLSLPPSLLSLHLGTIYNQPLTDDVLPRGLKRLYFSTDYNFPPPVFPDGLTHLWMGDMFNQPIQSLPSCLTHLAFGWQHLEPSPAWDYEVIAGLYHSQLVRNSSTFNQPLAGLLPPSLISLLLGGQFNHPLSFPPNNNITHLKVGNDFNHKLPFHQTANLRKLEIANVFYRFLTPAEVPPTLTHLTYPRAKEDFSALTHLISFSCVSSAAFSTQFLPPNLEKASIFHCGWHPFQLNTLYNLSHLVFISGRGADVPLLSLPPSIYHLYLAGFKFENVPSTTLTHLTLAKLSKRIVLDTPNLTHLTILKMKTTTPLPSLPALSHLAFGGTCTKENKFDINEITFPPTITHLKLPPGLLLLERIKLPPNLLFLSSCSRLGSLIHLPPSLHTLKIPTNKFTMERTEVAEHLHVIYTSEYEEGYAQCAWDELDWQE